MFPQAITLRLTFLLATVCLTHETGKQDNSWDLTLVSSQFATNYRETHTIIVFKERSPTVNDEILSKEQRILRVLRKVLASIVKDATPAAGQPHPLKQSTIFDIRDLFGLISEREAELADQAKPDRNEKPFYTDEPNKSNVIKMPKSGKKTKPEGE